MTRVRSLEGRDAGIVAQILQFLLKMNVGKNINPLKVQAHSTRTMVANFIANAIMGTGKTAVGNDIRELVKIRAAARNGCPF
jgi:alkylhydroperoxidase family enzyme